MTETRLTPWYRNTIEIDRAWLVRFNASIEGRPYSAYVLHDYTGLTPPH
jgi:hypothetical protein